MCGIFPFFSFSLAPSIYLSLFSSLSLSFSPKLLCLEMCIIHFLNNDLLLSWECELWLLHVNGICGKRGSDKMRRRSEIEREVNKQDTVSTVVVVVVFMQFEFVCSTGIIIIASNKYIAFFGIDRNGMYEMHVEIERSIYFWYSIRLMRTRFHICVMT